MPPARKAQVERVPRVTKIWSVFLMKIPAIVLLPSLCLAGPDDAFVTPAENLSEAPISPLSNIFSGIQRFDQEFDFLKASDVSVWRTSSSYRQERSDWNIQASVGYTDLSIDYTDPTGSTNTSHRNTDSWSGSITLGKDLSDNLSTTVGFSVYDGFNDYASLWISEYYDQFVGLNDPTNYQTADPQGYAFNTGLVWDYDPGVSRLSLALSYGNDQIVPAWSAVPDPITFIPKATPTRDSFDTYTGTLTWSKALSPSLKTQVTFRYSDVTELEPKYQLQSDWAWAITDDLTLRSQIGGSVQDPDFEAVYGGLSLEYDLTNHWSVGLSARYYYDSGEVVPIGFNTAAPKVTSTELSASVAWKNINTTMRLSTGIYDVDYGQLPPANQFFSDLYRDRSFTLGRLAISHQF